MKHSTRSVRVLTHCVVTVLTLMSQGVQAVSQQTGDSVNYTFTGTLQAATACSISNDQVIDVPFGNVGISKVESGNFIRPITYTLDCGGAGAANTIRMTLKATPVPSDESTMATSAQGLWASFLKDGTPLKLNEAFIVNDALSPPRLEVKLVKDPGTALTESAFTATATLIAEYV